jgi:hypothetical protein
MNLNTTYPCLGQAAGSGSTQVVSFKSFTLKDKVDGSSPSPQMAITPFKVKAGFIALKLMQKTKKEKNVCEFDYLQRRLPLTCSIVHQLILANL